MSALVARIFLVFAFLATSPVLADSPSARFEQPEVVLVSVPFTVRIAIDRPPDDAVYRLEVDDKLFAPTEVDTGILVFSDLRTSASGQLSLRLMRDQAVYGSSTVRAIAGWLAIVPPLVGIMVALILRSVIPALFLGTWVGAWLLTDLSVGGIGTSLLAVFDVHVRAALIDPDHAAIILFSLMIGGMVGIVFKNGGMEGIVAHVIRWARTPRQGQLATAALGTALFFDDYSNTLVVGNAMRPVTDRLRISREKLAFLVDATAAPIACIAVVTTWVGYEVGLIDADIRKLDGFDQSAYVVYLRSIAYSFYPLLMLLFVYLVAATGRDFSTMARAERGARDKPTAAADTGGAAMTEAAEVAPHDGTPRRALNGIIPVVVLIVGVITGLLVTGEGDNLQAIIGSADPYKALMWSSLASALVAGALSLIQRILTLEETVMAWYAGVKMMMLAMIVLILAWSLGSLTETLNAAGFLLSVLGDAIPVGLVPATIFIVAAATAFATGTSFGTMGILLPLAVPLTWAILGANEAADPAHYHIMYSAIASVLCGAVWGDHCSPISDTTILSSMASQCPHIDHVTTQLPYALSVGAVGLLLGTVPAGFGLPWWLALAIGSAVVALLLLIAGRTTPTSYHHQTAG